MLWFCSCQISAEEPGKSQERERLESIKISLVDFDAVPIDECLKIIRDKYERKKANIPIYRLESPEKKPREITFEKTAAIAPVTFSAVRISTWNAVQATTAMVGLEVKLIGDNWLVVPGESQPPFTTKKTAQILDQTALATIRIEQRSPSQAFAKVLYDIDANTKETFPMYIYPLVTPARPGKAVTVSLESGSARATLNRLADATGSVVEIDQWGHLQIYAPLGLDERENGRGWFDFWHNFEPYSVWPGQSISYARHHFMQQQQAVRDAARMKKLQQKRRNLKPNPSNLGDLRAVDPFGGGSADKVDPFGPAEVDPFGAGSSEKSERPPYFPATGYQPPEPPDLEIQILGLNGKSIPLKSLWKSDDALILTCSLNSNHAIETARRLRQIVEGFEPYCKVYLIYTRGVTAKAGSISAHQSLEQRIIAARDFKQKLKIDTPIYIDFMDNQVWESLGWSPNASLFVDHDGGYTRQGVFNPEILLDSLARAKRFDDRKVIHDKVKISTPDFDEDSLFSKRLNLKTDTYEYPGEDENISRLRKALIDTPELVNYFYRPDRKGASNSNTYLHTAAERGQLKLVEFLLNHGADPNIRSLHSGKTPLHNALKRSKGENDTKIVNLLLKAGDVNQLTDDGRNGIHFSIEAEGITNLNLAAEAGGNLSALSKDGISPLHEALYQQKPETVARLLELGAEIDVSSLAGLARNQEFYAIVETRPELMNQFQGESGRTPLIYASIAGNTELVENLTKHSHYSRAHLKGCFLKALKCDQFDCALILAGHIGPNYYPNDTGASITQAPHLEGWDNFYGAFTVIHEAAKKNQAAIVGKLIDCGWHVDHLDIDDRTPLHVAAAKGNLETVRLLVEKGATIDAREGYTHKYDAPGYIEPRTPPTPPKKQLNTPLHYAVSRFHADCVEYLLANGADQKIKNVESESPLFKLTEYKHGWTDPPVDHNDVREILSLLLRNGSSLEETNRDQKTLREVAAGVSS